MRVHQFKALVFWCPKAKKALAFPKNSFSFSSSHTRRRTAVISASISRESGRSSRTAWRRPRSSVTHRPTTDSPSPQSRATDAIVDPVSNTKDGASRRHSGVKRRREPITGTSLAAGTRTRFTKCQQHQPKPKRSRGDPFGGVVGVVVVDVHHHAIRLQKATRAALVTGIRGSHMIEPGCCLEIGSGGDGGLVWVVGV